MPMKKIAPDEFDKAVDDKAFVYFTQSDCGSCKQLLPLLEPYDMLEVENGLPFKRVMFKNAVTAVPAVLVFQAGMMRAKLVGKQITRESLDELKAKFDL